MIICNSRKFIFVHIPKCGGDSVSGFLSRYLRIQDVNLNVSPHQGWDKLLQTYSKRFGINKHSFIYEIERAIGPAWIDDYQLISFSRNPFSRAYSAFTFTLKGDAKFRSDSDRYRDIKNMSFEQFLKSPYMQEYKMPQARPQSDWLRGYIDRVHLFRLENIESDLLSIADKYLGVQVNASDVPHNNASTSKDAWFGISQEAQELILDLYEEDFELLGYEKKLHVS